ncbi:MAG: META domain-containing protein [Burkholderiales bacterium]|jgi:heat shock protein HslJ|nr:META domain-containing protein [Burkholderiales bacterium]
MLRALVLPAALTLALAACAGSNATTAGAPPSLPGTEWRLQELGGAKAIANTEASLAFLDGNRASGSATCNRFTATYELSGSAIKFGPIATTRRACPPDLTAQEDRFLAALQAAERVASAGPDLLVFSKGADKPLRFSRATGAKPAQ